MTKEEALEGQAFIRMLNVYAMDMYKQNKLRHE